MNVAFKTEELDEPVEIRCIKRKALEKESLEKNVFRDHSDFESRGKASTKRLKRGATELQSFPEEEKENIHRSRRLAPRARPATVLAALFVDAPTDCSDFEISDESDDEIGRLYIDQVLRMSDGQSERYHFSVFED